MDIFIKNAPDVSALDIFLLSSERDIEEPKVSVVSSYIISVVPDEILQPKVQFGTEWIAKQVAEGLLQYRRDQFWAYFNLFWSLPPTHSGAGAMWEAHILALMSNGENIPSVRVRKWLSQSRPSAGDMSPTTLGLRFTYSRVVEFSDLKSLVELLAVHVTDNMVEPILLRPRARNQATFDAVSISTDHRITLFQITVSGGHSVQLSGLTFVQDALKKAKRQSGREVFGRMLLPSNTSSQSEPRLTPIKNWNLVFCIPETVASQWSGRKRTISGGSTDWSSYIDQYLATFEDEISEKSTF